MYEEIANRYFSPCALEEIWIFCWERRSVTKENHLNVVAAIDAEWSTLAPRPQRGNLAATMNKEVLPTLAHARTMTRSQPAAFYTTLFSHSCLNYVKPELFCHGQQSSCLFGPDGVTIYHRKPVKSLQIDLLKSYYLINCVITTQVLIDRGILWHLLDL